MKKTLYKGASWWLNAVDKAGPVVELTQNETNPTLARASLAESVLNCEIIKARAEVRAKLFLRNLLTGLKY